MGVSINAVQGSTDRNINAVQFDSRKIESGDLFVAIIGLQSDGHQYIEQAENKGVFAVVCEILPQKRLDSITYIVTDNSKHALAIIASNYFENPSQKLNLVGITGTNGKTTCASLLYQLFQYNSIPSGLISTVKICVGKFHLQGYTYYPRCADN